MGSAAIACNNHERRGLALKSAIGSKPRSIEGEAPNRGVWIVGDHRREATDDQVERCSPAHLPNDDRLDHVQ